MIRESRFSVDCDGRSDRGRPCTEEEQRGPQGMSEGQRIELPCPFLVELRLIADAHQEALHAIQAVLILLVDASVRQHLRADLGDLAA